MSATTESDPARVASPRRSFVPQPGREAVVELAFRRAAIPGGGSGADEEGVECATDYVRAALEEIARERSGHTFDLWHPPASDEGIGWPLALNGHAFRDRCSVEVHLCEVLEGAGHCLVLHDCAGRAFRLHPRVHLHPAESGGGCTAMMDHGGAADELAFGADVTIRLPADRRPCDLEAYVAARVGEVSAALRRVLRGGPWTFHAPDPRHVPIAPVAWAGETILSIAEAGEALQRGATLLGVPRWGSDGDGRLVGWTLSVAVERMAELDRPVEEIWSLAGGSP